MKLWLHPVLVTVGFCWMAQGAAAEEKELPQRIFIVQNIIDDVEDAPAPKYSLDPAGDMEESLRREYRLRRRWGQEDTRPRLLNKEELVEMIRDSDTYWKSTTDPGADIQVFGVRLRVQAPPEVIGRVEALLRMLEAEATRTVDMHAVVFRMSEEVRKGWGGVEGKGQTLPGLRVKKLEEVLAGKKNAVLMRGTFHGLNAQVVHLACGRERIFLADIDPQVAAKAGEINVQTDKLRDGLSVEVRPFFGVDRKTIKLDYSVNYSRYEEKIFNTKNPKIGSVDLPSLRYFRSDGTTVVENGGGILFGPLPGGLARDAEKKAAAEGRKTDGGPAGSEGERKSEGADKAGNGGAKAEAPVYLLLYALASTR
jgi:hypothetical protein